MKVSEAQKPRPHELLWILWFDEKIIFNVHTFFINIECDVYTKSKLSNCIDWSR